MIAKFRLDVPEFQEILFRLKSPAFREEQEWRLLLFTHNKTQSFLYRAKQNCIIPYLKIALMGLTCSPIVEVILGPKHITPLEVIQKFLEQNDYSAKVTPSAASYRWVIGKKDEVSPALSKEVLRQAEYSLATNGLAKPPQLCCDRSTPYQLDSTNSSIPLIPALNHLSSFDVRALISL